MFLVRLGLRPWKIAPLSQIACTLAVGVLLSLSGVLLWVEQSIRPMVTRLETEQVVTVYLKNSVKAKSIEATFEAIKKKAPKGVVVDLVRRDQFLKEMGQHYPELATQLSEIGFGLDLIVPQYVSLRGNVSNAFKESVSRLADVESIESSKDRYRSLVGIFAAARWIGNLFIIGLLMTLLTCLLHLGRINGLLHAEVLTLMRYSGAGPFMLRAPSAISGLSVGFLGGGLAFILWSFGDVWLFSRIQNFSPALTSLSVKTYLIPFALLGAGCLLGLFSGLFTSWKRG